MPRLRAESLRIEGDPKPRAAGAVPPRSHRVTRQATRLAEPGTSGAFFVFALVSSEVFPIHPRAGSARSGGRFFGRSDAASLAPSLLRPKTS